MIAIIDYGMGNLRSVAKALESLGAEIKVTASPAIIKKASGVILPGVGAMPDAMKALRKAKVISSIKKTIAEDKPFLGICLGLQLLFETSEEGGGCKGLGIFKGSVPRFNFSQQSTLNNACPPTFAGRELSTAFKVPHMGWNTIAKTAESSMLKARCKSKSIQHSASSIQPLSDIPDNSYVYFVHSYYVRPKDKKIIATTTNYGIEFCSAIAKGNLFACQFHPEKSQIVGLKILKNFIKLCESA